jgi:topoisomerase-4 subunit A
VIEIIREEDEPKPVMIAEFALTDRQAEAILNMRLRSLRKARGDAAQRKERERAREGARGAARSWSNPGPASAPGSRRIWRRFASATARKPSSAAAARDRGSRPAREIPLEAMIEREPITVIMSQRGWIRAMKGHVDLGQSEALKFKEGDGPLSSSTPRPPTSCCSPPPTAASTRSRPTSCRAGAASASRCG